MSRKKQELKVNTVVEIDGEVVDFYSLPLEKRSEIYNKAQLRWLKYLANKNNMDMYVDGKLV